MLFHLKFLTAIWGPFRIMGSHLVLTCLGTILSGLAVWRFLPRLWHVLPRDRGKKLVKEGELSAGKPTGAGCLMMLLTLPVLLLVLPFSGPGFDAADTFGEFIDGLAKLLETPSSWLQLVNPQWAIVVCLVAAMLAGYFDDKSPRPWGRLKKGLIDAVIAFAAACFICRFQAATIWLPFWKDPVVLPMWGYILMAVPVLWITMNATNCSDGVDGLAGSLTLLSLFALAVFLYGVVGHQYISRYLLVPHNPEGARWGILVATFAGSIAGYLWHNAQPSSVLMGDAGSRFLGLLVGVAVLTCGNPFLVLVVAPIVLVNGGTGLFKIFLLKTLARLGFNASNPNLPHPEGAPDAQPDGRPCWLARQLHKVRFPLHDHCRTNLNWSNAQVLMRFVLIQAVAMPILFLILVKIR
ncbi:MAG: hypothetical protein ACOX9C_04060 [Kiritimatiellia bacterium]|jgi:phospho-N-acetylmuramoyl-pentapeptide-transferase